MEIEFENTSEKLTIPRGSEIELGRSSCSLLSGDRTVSRRHIKLLCQQHTNDPSQEPTLSFQVIGKNPIWVLTISYSYKRVFRNSEKGHLRPGDRLSLSLKNPLLFTFKQADEEEGVLEAVERRKITTLERERGENIGLSKDEFCIASGGVNDAVEEEIGGLELGCFDFSKIDPVQEFGFVVIGQEFSNYPKQKIRHFKAWNWFLEEPRDDSDDDEVGEKEKLKRRTAKKRKKNGGEVDNDDDWTGESEEEVVIAEVRKGKRLAYSTRSKDPSEDASRKKSMCLKTTEADEDENDEDEDEETLSGFIVNDNTVDEEEGDVTDIDEEEEFDEDDDRDED